MKLNIQMFGGRGASSSNQKNIPSKVIDALNSGENVRQQIEKLGQKNKFFIMTNTAETTENDILYDNVISKRTNTSTLYSYANAKNRNDYENLKPIGVIRQKAGKWEIANDITSNIIVRGREVKSIIIKKKGRR